MDKALSVSAQVIRPVHLMREDLAAVNVTHSNTLAGMNIAIFTFMLFFLNPRFESHRLFILGARVIV
jgi:hypothetical protein